MTWRDDQEFERKWWADCVNTYAEEVKQLTYAYKMGLTATYVDGKWPCYDLGGARVLDIGGGPVSMLLKTVNRGYSMVADPCDYPDWIRHRYAAANIEYVRATGEYVYVPNNTYDEVWIYNVLQHTEDPEFIVRRAREFAPVVRIFEWIDIPAHEGHPQELKEDKLNEWLDGEGETEWLDENWCLGQAYYGVFVK